MSHAKSAERVIQDVRRNTRRRFSAEEKIRIVLEGLRGEESIAALCRREGLNPNFSRRARSGCWVTPRARPRRAKSAPSAALVRKYCSPGRRSRDFWPL